jgi:hypothetical protein
VIGEGILLDGAIRPRCHSGQSAEDRSDQQEPQTYPDAPAHFIINRTAIDRQAEIRAEYATHPTVKTFDDRCLVIEIQFIETGVNDLGWKRGVAAFEV